MTSTEQPAAQPVVLVQRWQRWGHDRGYVRLGEQQVGYRDLKTGAIHGASQHTALIATATDHLVRAAEPGRPVAAAAGPDQASGYRPRHAQPESAHQGPAAAGTGALQPDLDLAGTVAGTAARQQATALRQAAPVRTLFARLIGQHTEERAWRIGADAEGDVGGRLAKLGSGWQVLHAVPVGDRGSDIDHVVIGPAGVFTINTKHHPEANVWVAGDTIKVNGQNRYYVRNSRHEAERASRLLSTRAGIQVPVHGLIVVMGAQRGFTVKHQPKDGAVSVLTRKALCGHLRSRPVILDGATVDRIYQAARHLATWQPGTVRWSDQLPDPLAASID